MRLEFQNVCVEGFACSLPEEIVTSEQIEARLEPLYTRLRLPEGRLELMTGIRQRRFWPPGMPPSEMSVQTGEKLLAAAGLDRRHVGALVHGSVCRDFLEPATACSVHHRLGLSAECLACDVSNACLGLLNGMVQVASLIELGQIRAGLVVGTESGRSLVEATIDQLNRDTTLTRNDVKSAFASLTIGSGSAAILLCDRELSRTGNRLLGGVARANTEFCGLCQGDHCVETGETRPLMATDSETLLHRGVETAAAAFGHLCETLDWPRETIHRTFCHQVGRAHQKLLLETLGLDPSVDFATVQTLGNTGAVALPITAALGVEQGLVRKNDRVALLGIGSGINCLMLGVEWQRSLTSPPAGDRPSAFASKDAGDDLAVEVVD